MIHPREIFEARDAGEIRYAVILDYQGDMNRVLAKAGLTPDASQLAEQSRSDALAILAVLLQKDMAYETPAMSESEAQSLAASILKSHEQPDSRYFSNGNWAKRESWNPLTKATFDSGIVMTCGKNLFFCIWFEDED